jgi:MOSC domain-containing protein YiiM
MARVLHLFRAPKRRAPMEELASAEVVKDAGFEGCAHARPGNRQVLLADAETLGAFQLEPGIMRENVSTEGLDVNGLAIGQRLRLGQVALEVSACAILASRLRRCARDFGPKCRDGGACCAGC